MGDTASGLPRFTQNLTVSLDQRWVSSVDPEGLVTAYPVEGGEAIHATALGAGHLPAGWLEDGTLLAFERFKVPTRVQAFDLRTGRTAPFSSEEPRDAAGVVRIVRAQVTPDGRTVVLNHRRMSGTLLLLDWRKKRGGHGADEPGNGASGTAAFGS